MGSNTDAKIILYTNHRCPCSSPFPPSPVVAPFSSRPRQTPLLTRPGAHRAHIALELLKIPFEEVIIDLGRPRDPWYLEVNPRGLVPSLSYNGQILTESAVVTQFLADLYPSKLLPESGSPEGALRRARVAFFVDAFFTKVQSQGFKFGGAKTEEEIDAVADAYIAAVVKEIEPLLQDAAPFFGGAAEITLAEVRDTPPFPL